MSATFFQVFAMRQQHFSPVIAVQHIAVLIHIRLQYPMCHMLDCMGVALIYVSLLKSVALLSVGKMLQAYFEQLEKCCTPILHSTIDLT